MTEVVAIATLVQGVVVVIAAILALRQLRESSRARVSSLLLEIFQIIHSDQCAEDRRIALSSSASSSEGRAATRRVVELWEWIGLLVRKGMLPPELVLDMYSDLIISTWRAARPLILEVRSASSNYAEHLEYLFGLATDFRRWRYQGKGNVERAWSGDSIGSEREEPPSRSR